MTSLLGPSGRPLHDGGALYHLVDMSRRLREELQSLEVVLHVHHRKSFPQRSKRRSHSTTNVTDMDEETRARLARREERRRRREQEEGAPTSSRSSSVPRPPSPSPFGAAPKRVSQPPPTKPAYFSNVDFSAKQESRRKGI